MRRLVCSATHHGVTLYRKTGKIFYPKTVACKQAAERSTYDEIFLDRCLQGTKNIPTFVLQRMSKNEIERIQLLHQRSISLIIKLKKEVANSWSSQLLRPISRPSARISKVVAEIGEDLSEIPRDFYLDIHIPRPILINNLIQLNKHVYQDQD